MAPTAPSSLIQRFSIHSRLRPWPNDPSICGQTRGSISASQFILPHPPSQHVAKTDSSPSAYSNPPISTAGPVMSHTLQICTLMLLKNQVTLTNITEKKTPALHSTKHLYLPEHDSAGTSTSPIFTYQALWERNSQGIILVILAMLLLESLFTVDAWIFICLIILQSH